MADLNFYKMHDDVNIPAFQTLESACFDIEYNPAGKNSYIVYNHVNDKIDRQLGVDNKAILMAGDRAILPTGLILDIPKNYSVRVHPRSSMAIKLGLPMVNCEAIIDADYTDELFIALYNISSNRVMIDPGTRIAQAELYIQYPYAIKEIPRPPTQRGNRKGGIGSTGK